MKQAGERSAGKRPAAFDEAGAGNVATAAGLRATAKAVELPPEPNVRAPVLDPTAHAAPNLKPNSLSAMGRRQYLLDMPLRYLPGRSPASE